MNNVAISGSVRLRELEARCVSSRSQALEELNNSVNKLMGEYLRDCHEMPGLVASDADEESTSFYKCLKDIRQLISSTKANYAYRNINPDMGIDYIQEAIQDFNARVPNDSHWKKSTQGLEEEAMGISDREEVALPNKLSKRKVKIETIQRDLNEMLKQKNASSRFIIQVTSIFTNLKNRKISKQQAIEELEGLKTKRFFGAHKPYKVEIIDSLKNEIQGIPAISLDPATKERDGGEPPRHVPAPTDLLDDSIDPSVRTALADSGLL